MPNTVPHDDEVRTALQHLLEWPELVRSEQLSKFLSYIVERKLAGEPQSIKAYSIAVDVFGRAADFDPQTDPIVRVQARRLRALLAEYYAGPGEDEAVRIDLPTGRYIPDFVYKRPSPTVSEPLEDTAEPSLQPSSPPLSFWASWRLLAVATLGATLLMLLISWQEFGPPSLPRENALLQQPSIVITEFQSLDGGGTASALASGLAIEMVTDLEPFEMMNVTYGGKDGTAQGEADFVLSGIVRQQEGGLQFSAILTESASNAVVWNQAIVLDGDEARRPDLVDYISVRISRALASPRGPLFAPLRTYLASNGEIDNNESLFVCRVLFDLYREASSPENWGKAQRCFAALQERGQNSGQGSAAMASLMIEDGRDGSARGLDPSETVVFARAMLDDAVEAAPVSAFVWEQRGRFYEDVGEDDLSEAAYSSSLQLNPASTDAMAARARHMALHGQLDNAVPLAEAAIEDAPDAPDWYFGVPALNDLRRHEFVAAVDHAVVYAEADRRLGPILAMMAGQGVGDAAVVNRYLPQVLDNPEFRSDGVLRALNRRIRDENLLHDIRVALLSAGVPAAALMGPF